MTIYKNFGVPFLVCYFCVSQASFAAEIGDLNVLGGITLNNKSMELTIRDREFRPNFTSLGLSVTGGVNSIYVTLNRDQSIKDDIEAIPTGLIFYSRIDTSLELNYILSRQLRLSIGYRTGETDSFFTTTNDAFGTSERGFFIGGNYAYGFGKTGTLFASLAIAKLDGEVSLREPFVDTSAFVVGPAAPSNIEGDATGFSLGLGWTGSVSDKTQYSAGVKLHSFEFEDNQVFGGLDLSYEQNFTIISIGLVHLF